MRRSVFIVAISMLLQHLLVAPIAAQDATPGPAGAVALAPAVGDPFPYMEAETGAQATITVAAVDDPAADVAVGAEPAADTRYVMLTVVYENIGAVPVETRPDAVVVQDRDGFLWSPTSVTRRESVAIPDLQRVAIAPGDRITGMVGFQLPATAELARVFYQPESSRLLVLAELTASSPSPAVGTAVAYEDLETTAQAQLTVAEIQDPFTEVPDGYEAEAGSRYAVLTITVENTGAVPWDISPGDLLLRDGDGYLWGYTSVNRGNDVVMPDLQSQNLAPGSRITGAVGFQLPAGAEVADILYQPVSGRLLFLARLQPTAGTSAAVAAIASDCEGVAAWYTETAPRISRATELSQQAAQLESEASLEAAVREYEALAAAQAAMPVPAAAEPLNAELVASFTAYHEALSQIITAGDDGGDLQAAIIDGMNVFNATSQTFADVHVRVDELVTACGV